MGETIEPIIDYVRLPKGTLLDVIGPIIVVLLFIVILYFAWKAQKRQNRAMALIKSKEVNRRYYKRIPVTVPVQVTRIDRDDIAYEAEVLDVSLGGLRLLTPLEGIAATMHYRITSETAPWNAFGDARLMILKLGPGPNEETAILRARWIGLTRGQRKMLTNAIKRQLKRKSENS